MSTSHLIVVGVDGSEGGRRALRWAAAEADARGGAVQAVIAWSWDGIDYTPVMAAGYPEQVRQESRKVLEAEVQRVVAERGSHLPIAMEVVEGEAAAALTTASRGADLLVLGSHGHSRLRHTVLGSVSEACIRRAACPVVVVPVPVPQTDAVNEPALRS
ncbi:universal stress protein [Actinoplanes sp. N902-109]|uniref:universal stress protein n=1 Tax=Actinoplanes sp. (strain N902-109) TaxID=649831 RepID=UPI000329677E|nr:universal stress protein [Actinoplanes sp. N902-109]AGL16948.1 universal stress protein [Actinoplanes sp. N902-109]